MDEKSIQNSHKHINAFTLHILSRKKEYLHQRELPKNLKAVALEIFNGAKSLIPILSCPTSQQLVLMSCYLDLFLALIGSIFTLKQ